MPIPAPAGNAAVPHKHEQEHTPAPPEAIIEPVPESIIELVEVAAGAAATAAIDDAAEEAATAIDDAAEGTAGAAAIAEDAAMLLAVIAIATPAVPFCCIAICIN